MAKIDKYLDPTVAVPLVRAYFKGVAYPDGSRFEFTGRKFESLARGGNRADAADRITYDDIVAVSTLGVDIPARASLCLLGEDARRVSALLRQLPRRQHLADVNIDDLHAPEHPAMRLWSLLVSQRGIGPTKASKLMSRKRPHLIPVFDKRIGGALGSIDDHWRLVHEVVSERTPALVDIRKKAGVGNNISLLRVLDVAVWMRATGAAQVLAATGVKLLPKKKAAKKAKKKG